MKARSIRPRVFIVDDEPEMAQATAASLEHHGYPTETFLSAEEFLSAVPGDAVGCVIIDVVLPGMKGDELQRRAAQTHPCLAVIVVTGNADVALAVQVMEHGAVTLLEKPYPARALVDAVQRAIELSELKCHETELKNSVRDQLSSLTDEERQVMRLMVQGLPNKRIVMELQLSSRTVDRRRAAVMNKMQVSSVAELASKLSRLDDW